DIVDVVSEYVVLRKRGKDYVGLCPFHDEKTPSFSVSPSKQMYHCFGCSAGGNAITFLRELGKRSFTDVVLDLARRYQVPVQTLEPERHQELQRQLSLREQLHEILALAAAFYQHALRQPQGQQALTYLQTTRRFSEETIQQFQLGYAPIGWATIYRYLVEQKSKPVQLVEQAGLILPRKEGNGYYDRFRDRLMIPIRDTQGRVIGFGGRSLGDEQPKYLNSPETELFNKSKILFALDKARDTIQKQDRAVVVEGYFDAIALHAAGIKNVVASMGTAFSLDQVRQLLRYTESKQIILNFDADAAGTNASVRAIGEIAPLVYAGQVKLRVLNLPEGKDADEFLRGHPHATEQYQQLLADAPLWLDWQLRQILIDKDLKQADQFQQVSHEMVKLLNQLDDINQLSYYINYCAQLLSQGQTKLVPLYIENLQVQLKKPIVASIKKSSSPRLQKPGNKNYKRKLLVGSESGLLEEAEALLLQIYLHCPEHRQTIIEKLDEQDLVFSLPHHRFLWQQILEIESTIPASRQMPDPLISRLQDRSLEYPEQMSQVSHLFYLDEERKEDLPRISMLIPVATACMEIVAYEKHRRSCLEQWQNLNPLTDRERCKDYVQKATEAQQRIWELERIRQCNIAEVMDDFAS
ncbi:MAG TPA: DNA primase, partial [Cyanophyceae cyanobacterium]